MEELRELMEILKDMPTLAIVVIALYFAFKVVVVGSIYGVIRFVSQKLHDVAVKKKEPAKIDQSVTVELQGKVITSTTSDSHVRAGDIDDLFDAVLGLNDHSYIFRSDIKKAINLIKEGSTK